jgi:uncharacterized protein involved in type VI secretion and phage assembly
VSRTLDSITNANFLERTSRHRIHGVCVAIVTDNNDSEGKYRVKVRYPWLDNGDASGEQSYWARICTFGAGQDRGGFFLPEVDDEVLVAFEHGDISYPYVIGTLWNSKQTTIEKNSDQGGKNNLRKFKSRSGHYLEFDDSGDNKITVKTTGGHILLMDDPGPKIELKTSDGANYLLLNEGGSKITLETTSGDMLIKAANTIDIEATTINVKSSANTKMEAGANWDTKAGSNFTLKASGTGTVESGGVMTIKGSIVNIN